MRKQVTVIVLILIFIIFPFNLNFSVQENEGKSITTIILDAGHGGKDPGTTSLSGAYEKNIVLNIVLKVRDFIEREYSDLRILLTREKDEFIELKDRGIFANSNRGNLFISIHCNAKKNEENDKKGFEIYLLDPVRIPEAMDITSKENKIFDFLSIFPDSSAQNIILTSLLQNSFFRNSERFSSVLQYELALESKLVSRGVMEGKYYVLLASMPSVLIECGYLSNADDEAYLLSDEGQTEIARALYKAIILYKNDFDFENSDK